MHACLYEIIKLTKWGFGSHKSGVMVYNTLWKYAEKWTNQPKILINTELSIVNYNASKVWIKY